MEVIRAKSLGFCAGVKKAMETVDQAFLLSRDMGVPCYIYGDIVHNRFVMEHFTSSGIKKIEDPEEYVIPGVLIIRTHGITDEFREAFINKGFTIVDATCPVVRHNQMLLREAKHKPLIIGYRGHSEVISLEGSSKEKVEVIECAKDVERLSRDCKYSAIVQTTFSTSILSELVSKFDELGIDVELMNTICNSSHLRRNGVRELKGKVDAIVVVGDRKSANTNELVSIATSCGMKGFLVENIDDINLELRHYNKIGLTAGASTPKYIYDEVEECLRSKDGRS